MPTDPDDKTFQFPAGTDMEEKIFIALGAASACWSNLSGAGEFNSTWARVIGVALLAEVRSYLVLDASLEPARVSAGMSAELEGGQR